MEKILKFIKNSIYVSLISLIFIGWFIYSTINENKAFKLSNLNSNNDTSKNKVKEALQEGALFERNALGTFILFSREQKHPETVLEDWKNKGFIKSHRGKSKIDFVLKDIELNRLLENSCIEINCFQSKMLFNRIPSTLWKGLMGIEDYRFLDHFGLDLFSIFRALVVNLKSMRLKQGGSTITQQLVKNLYLSNEKTFIRKIKEAIISIYLEVNYSKEDIIEAYFNEVYWGTFMGIKLKGLMSASLFYFSKKPDQLSIYESSILIGMLKGPGYFSPFSKKNRLKKRADLVFKRLIDLGLVSSENKNERWNLYKWKSWLKKLFSIKNRGHFRALFLSQKAKGKLLNQYEKFVFTYKSLELFKNNNNNIYRDNIGMKAYWRDIRNSKLDFFSYSRVGKKLRESINNEKHLVGSILKPILYKIILDYGHDFNEMISTDKIIIRTKSGKWSPGESRSLKRKSVTIKESLLMSLNRPMVRILNGIGWDKIEIDFKRYVPQIKIPLRDYPAQVLGSVELSLKEVVDIYSKFIKEECVEKKNLTGIDSTIGILSDPLKTTIRKVVSKNIALLKFFGKTGTSNNGLDSWFIFFDGKTIGAIWVGYEGNRINKQLPFYGSTTSFKVFNEFLKIRGKRFHEFSCDYINSKNDALQEILAKEELE